MENTHSLILTIAETVDGIDFVLIPNESFIQGTILSNEVGLSGVSVSTSESSDISDDNGDIKIQAKTGEDSIIANNDGSVELYHDNSKKFETTSAIKEVPKRARTKKGR